MTDTKPVTGRGMNPGMYAKMSAYIFCNLIGFMIGLPLGALTVALFVVIG